MYGINLKFLVAMVTELCTHFISAMACNACRAPEIFILHTSANFEKSKTKIFSYKYFFSNHLILCLGSMPSVNFLFKVTTRSKVTQVHFIQNTYGKQYGMFSLNN